MDAFFMLVSFIIAVIVSVILQYFLPRVPLAFIQIGIGMLLFLTPIPVVLEFEPDLFLVGIIAPLLFLEGNQVSRRMLMKYIKPVILMAMGLVFFTSIGLGYFTHYLMPAVPLAACFALAAIICPTDAVAIQAFAKGKKLPRGMMTILEGESLLNDAAGILCFNIALVALMTGEFSMTGAVSQFVLTTIGGILVGVIIGYLFVQLRVLLTRSGFLNENILIMIQILTPFIIYLAAEMVHVSGVIAAVMGGIVHGIERDRISQTTTRIQIGYDNTWALLSTMLNGLVFTMLGYLIPEVVQHVYFLGEYHIVTLIIYTLLISLAVYLFRFVWVFILYNQFYLRESRFERALKHQSIAPEPRPSRVKYAFITTICGVHGTISMAIALTLPYYISNHQEFDAREDLLFIAAGVIMISLIIAQIILPLITPSEKVVKSEKLTYQEARIYIIDEGINYLNDRINSKNSIIISHLIKQYQMKRNFILHVDGFEENPKEIDRLQSVALNAEMETLRKLIANNDITASILDNYKQFTERTRAFSNASIVQKVKYQRKMFQALKRVEYTRNASTSLSIKKNIEELITIAQAVHFDVLQALSDEIKHDNKLEIAIISDRYLQRVEQLKRFYINDSFVDTEALLAIDTINEERSQIQKLIMNDKISKNVAIELRQSLNYDEMMLLKTYSD